MTATGLRGGYTTGACAAAAAKAAALLLCGQPLPLAIEIPLPGGERIAIPLLSARLAAEGAEAAVRKDAGDDPDVTHGVVVLATVRWSVGEGIEFAAGEGVGTVTLPGLAVPPGQPAINPGPRRMIREAVREVTACGLTVTVSIPGGRELAGRTFNPRLGIVGGLSVLGSTGRVRPFSLEAMRESMRCALAVTLACGERSPVFVPGHIGERAARRHLRLSPRQVVEVGNEWGFMLGEALRQPLERLLVLGHPGKLAKLSLDQWDTHSARSASAAAAVADLGRERLGRAMPETPTIEGLFMGLDEDARRRLGDALAERVCAAIRRRFEPAWPLAVGLVNMNGDWLGGCGELEAWR